MGESHVTWRSSALPQLDAICAYHMFRLRQSVFILEQQCFYPDIDRLDEDAIHVLGTDDSDQLLAYLRILAPGVSYAEPALGRVVVTNSERGTGLGRLLVEEGIRVIRKQFGNTDIRISAQSYLINFYESAGFKVVGEGYLEDNIPHQQMILTAA